MTSNVPPTRYLKPFESPRRRRRIQDRSPFSTALSTPWHGRRHLHVQDLCSGDKRMFRLVTHIALRDQNTLGTSRKRTHRCSDAARATDPTYQCCHAVPPIGLLLAASPKASGRDALVCFGAFFGWIWKANFWSHYLSDGFPCKRRCVSLGQSTMLRKEG
uniref:Uncharacterized protein n=1 Tax=Steinernema glaseri TaxID=37863 RepID=A0A1I7Y3F2_9BILA